MAFKAFVERVLQARRLVLESVVLGHAALFRGILVMIYDNNGLAGTVIALELSDENCSPEAVVNFMERVKVAPVGTSISVSVGSIGDGFAILLGINEDIQAIMPLAAARGFLECIEASLESYPGDKMDGPAALFSDMATSLRSCIEAGESEESGDDQTRH